MFKNVPYRFYIIEDYTETESAVIMIAHHALADGIAAIGLLNAIDTKKDFGNLPTIKGLTFT